MAGCSNEDGSFLTDLLGWGDSPFSNVAFFSASKMWGLHVFGRCNYFRGASRFLDDAFPSGPRMGGFTFSHGVILAGFHNGWLFLAAFR